MSYLLWENSIVSKISDRFFIYWIPYVILGILLQRNINLFNNINSKYNLFFIFLIPIEFYFFDNLNIKHSPYILTSVLIASSLISIYFLTNDKTIQKFMTKKISEFSIYISKKTLGIFVLNPFFVFLLKPYFSIIQTNNIILDFIIVLIFTIVVFISCLFIIELLSKTFLKRIVIN